MRVHQRPDLHARRQQEGRREGPEFPNPTPHGLAAKSPSPASQIPGRFATAPSSTRRGDIHQANAGARAIASAQRRARPPDEAVRPDRAMRHQAASDHEARPGERQRQGREKERGQDPAESGANPPPPAEREERAQECGGVVRVVKPEPHAHKISCRVLHRHAAIASGQSPGTARPRCPCTRLSLISLISAGLYQIITPSSTAPKGDNRPHRPPRTRHCRAPPFGNAAVLSAHRTAGVRRCPRHPLRTRPDATADRRAGRCAPRRIPVPIRRRLTLE